MLNETVTAMAETKFKIFSLDGIKLEKDEFAANALEDWETPRYPATSGSAEIKVKDEIYVKEEDPCLQSQENVQASLDQEIKKDESDDKDLLQPNLSLGSASQTGFLQEPGIAMFPPANQSTTQLPFSNLVGPTRLSADLSLTDALKNAPHHYSEAMSTQANLAVSMQPNSNPAMDCSNSAEWSRVLTLPFSSAQCPLIIPAPNSLPLQPINMATTQPVNMATSQSINMSTAQSINADIMRPNIAPRFAPNPISTLSSSSFSLAPQPNLAPLQPTVAAASSVCSQPLNSTPLQPFPINVAAPAQSSALQPVKYILLGGVNSMPMAGSFPFQPVNSASFNSSPDSIRATSSLPNQNVSVIEQQPGSSCFLLPQDASSMGNLNAASFALKSASVRSRRPLYRRLKPLQPKRKLCLPPIKKLSAPFLTSLPVSCQICSQVFPSIELLDDHISKHDYTTCHVCKTIFKSRITFMSHKCYYKDGNLFICSRCSYSVIDRPIIERHRCQKSAYSNDKRLEIVSFNKQNIEYECQFCLLKFPSQKNLKQHEENVHLFLKDEQAELTQHILEQSHFVCRTCNINFPSKEEFTIHAASHRQCPKCSTVCSTPQKFEEHIVIAHPNLFEEMSILNTCIVCNVSYQTRAELSAHSDEHSRKHRCPECSFSCRYEKTLDIHLKGHRVLYSCIICSITFKESDCFIRHLKVHNQEPLTEECAPIFYNEHNFIKYYQNKIISFRNSKRKSSKQSCKMLQPIKDSPS